jgi:hypothetical protein
MRLDRPSVVVADVEGQGAIVRTLPAVALGALLVFGLTPAAAVADSVPAPAGTSTSPTESPTPKPDPKPEDEVKYGTFAIDPESGPARTEVTATSKTACPLKRGGAVVDVLMYTEADYDSGEGEPVVRETLETDDSGAWTAKLTVPADAKPGTYVLVAACFGPDEEDFVEPCLIYEPVEFELTKAEEPVEPEEPEAPVAQPVEADPSYTG